MIPKWKKAILYVMKSPIGHLIPDKPYLTIKMRILCGVKMDWDNPKTLNEKMQWIKLNDRKPDYTVMADKYAARDWIKERIGSDYLVPLYGVWNNAKEIDFDALPDKFVLKTTHDSHGIVICKDKASLDIPKTIKFLNKRLKHNYFWLSREWCYKDIQPRIIAEELLEEDSELQRYAPIDYKMYIFNEKVNCTMAISGRGDKGIKINYYENDWTPVERNGVKVIQESPTAVPRPYNFDKMLEIGETLSRGIKMLRVDFYEVNKKLYIGELSFFSDAGFMWYSPDEYNEILGSELDLS